MKVLYISALSSRRLVNEIYKTSQQNPGFAVQKFSRLLVKGLLNNGADVVALSNPPGLSVRNKRFVSFSSEKEDSVAYKYIPYLNFPLLKHLCIFFYSFFYVLVWGSTKRKDKTIMCDVLSVSACMGSLLASKINRVKSVGVVTDIFGLMVGNKKGSWIVRMASYLNGRYVSSFDRYVLLTEQMNGCVNPKHHPYIVMEALCDASLMGEEIPEVEKVHPRTIIYAGGLNERYGLKKLAEAFVKANISDARLVYYGSGPYVDEYKRLCATHPNVEYRGVAPNEEIVAEEYKATLLINPRPTTEEFTQYSFPSKNMEYMASGTPLLTTKLPGMPEEYYPYIYLFDEESVEGYSVALKRVLSLPEDELKKKGWNARQYVLENKNYNVQARRVLNLICQGASSGNSLKH